MKERLTLWKSRIKESLPTILKHYRESAIVLFVAVFIVGALLL